MRIVTFLLKLSSQWVEYALACVYIGLAIGEKKKKKKKAKTSEFRLSSRQHGDCLFFPSGVRRGRGKLLKRKVKPISNVDLFMYRT